MDFNRDLSIKKKSGKRSRKKKNPFRTADYSHLLYMALGCFGVAMLAFLLSLVKVLEGVGLAGGMLGLMGGIGCLVGFFVWKASENELVFLEDVVQMRKGKGVVGQIPDGNVGTVELV